MSDQEIREMQRLIDEGIVLAQQRLMERARHDGFSLVVCKNGRVQRLSPGDL